MMFAFETTPTTQRYSEEVVDCMVKYAGRSQEQAIVLLNRFMLESPFPLSVFDDNNYMLHEDPYYTAMCIIHHPVLGDNRPNWHGDPNLWPPPKRVAG